MWFVISDKHNLCTKSDITEVVTNPPPGHHLPSELSSNLHPNPANSPTILTVTHLIQTIKDL